MKLFTTTLLTLCTLFSTSAQEPEIQDAWQRIRHAKAAKQTDSLAVACNDLANYYAMSNADSLLYYTTEGLKHTKTDQTTPYIDLLINKAVYYNAIGNHRQSINTLQTTLSEARRLQSPHFYTGNILSSMGVGYRRINQPDSALVCYKQALDEFRAAGDEGKGEIPFLMTNIAILYANTARLPEAERYAVEAVEQSALQDDLDTQLYASTAAGAILTLVEKYDRAEELMRSTLDRARDAGKARFVMQCTSPLLDLYNRTNNRADLDRLVRETRPWLAQIPPHSNEAMGYYEALGAIYYNTHRYERSLKYYNLLLEGYKQNATGPLYTIHLAIARNHAAMGHNTAAAQHYERSIALRDSLHNSDLTTQMSEFSVRFETQKKELQIARLKEEKLRQDNRIMKWSFAIGLSFIAVVVGAIYEMFRRRQLQRDAELGIARSFIDGLEKERTRLAKDLHDGICNDLLGVGMHLHDTATVPDTIASEIEEIRADLRAISHELTPPKFQYATLDELLADMTRKMFLSEGIPVNFKAEGNAKEWRAIPEHIAYEVYRITQELGANIIRHARAERVCIRLTIHDKELELRIENDGPEFDFSARANRGIGLSTIAERTKAIGATSTMDYKDQKQIFTLKTHFE